jgi:hypothetical protein
MEEEIRRIQTADTSSSGETSNSNQRTAECKQQKELDAIKRLEETRAKKKRIDGMCATT